MNAELLNRSLFANCVAEWITEERGVKSMSREALAAKIMVHRNTILRWERGYSKGGPDRSYKAGEKCDLTMADFVSLCKVFGRNPGKIMVELITQMEIEQC